MRVVFWGTPDFALPTLHALLDAHTVAGVVTRPDRPAGRGRKVRPSPVKRLAEDRGLPVLQPEKPRGAAFLEPLAAWKPEISVVAAYGAILPREVLDLPARGSINVHASLLPKLRGAAPVNWAIIRGLEETGVTIMEMVEELDAGPILHQVSCELPEGATAGRLSERLSKLGGAAVLEALDAIERGTVTRRPQDDADATYAPRLDRDDARIDWASPATVIDRWIRGTDPVPAAWTQLEELRVRMFSPRARECGSSSGEPGTVLKADPKEGLVVATGAATLAIEEVQPAGKRRMQATAWIQGRGVRVGQRFH